MKKHSTSFNSFLLFLTALIWGLAFVSQSKGMESMQPFTFNGIRSLMGAVVVLPLAFGSVRRARKQETAGNTAESGGQTEGKAQTEGNVQAAAGKQEAGGFDFKTALAGGLACGVLYTVASTFQQFGLAYTTVGKAGFITTLYIIFVPILGLFLKKKVPGIVWIGALMAAVGMYLLCMTESFSLTRGDTMVLICAVLFAAHILVVDYYVERVPGTVLSCMQLFVCGVSCTVAALLTEAPTFAQIFEGMVPLLYAGVMSCGVAYTLQIVGQKGVNPTVASLILSLESVVSALAGYFAFRMGLLQNDQTLTARQICGCAIVFAAVILVQLPVGKKSQKNKK